MNDSLSTRETAVEPRHRNRDVQNAIPIVRCMMQGGGGFDFLDTLKQMRFARLAAELDTAVRVLRGRLNKVERDHREMREIKFAGKDGAEPRTDTIVSIPEHRRLDYLEAVESVLDEAVEIQCPVIHASWLRAPKEDGTPGEIPTGWYETQDPRTGEMQQSSFSAAAILHGLGPFLVMDLEEVGAEA